jgi:hypothetical protein
MAQALDTLLLGENAPRLPSLRFGWDDERLVFVVREPFLSKSSGVELAAGFVEPGTTLEIESHMAEGGVIFSDGMEHDALVFNAGMLVRIGAAKQQTLLVASSAKAKRERAS